MHIVKNILRPVIALSVNVAQESQLIRKNISIYYFCPPAAVFVIPSHIFRLSVFGFNSFQSWHSAFQALHLNYFSTQSEVLICESLLRALANAKRSSSTLKKFAEALSDSSLLCEAFSW